MPAPIDPEIKAAVLAEIVAGASLSGTAKKYGVSRQVVRQWRDSAGVASVLPPESRDAVGEALASYVVKALGTLSVQLDLAKDLDWLKQHGPSALVSVHKALSEAIARVVEAEGQDSGEDDLDEPVRLRRAS